MPTPKPRRDDTLIKALVRAHRWRRRIERGQAKSITDLAEQEGVTDAYVCRLLPLTCLAADVVCLGPHPCRCSTCYSSPRSAAPGRPAKKAGGMPPASKASLRRDRQDHRAGGRRHRPDLPALDDMIANLFDGDVDQAAVLGPVDELHPVRLAAKQSRQRRLTSFSRNGVVIGCFGGW